MFRILHTSANHRLEIMNKQQYFNRNGLQCNRKYCRLFSFCSRRVRQTLFINVKYEHFFFYSYEKMKRKTKTILHSPGQPKDNWVDFPDLWWKEYFDNHDGGWRSCVEVQLREIKGLETEWGRGVLEDSNQQIDVCQEHESYKKQKVLK